MHRSGASLLNGSGTLLRHRALLDCRGTVLLHCGYASLLNAWSTALFHCRSTALLDCWGSTLLVYGDAALIRGRSSALRGGIGVLGHGGALLDGSLLFLTHCGGSCGDGAVSSDRTGRGDLGGFTVVGAVELLLVVRGSLCILTLLGEWGGVGLVEGSHFRGAWTYVDASIASVVAHTILNAAGVVDVVVDDGVVVGIAASTNVGDGAVVVEVIAAPVTSEVADADVAEAVIDTTVVADVGTPVAVVEAVAAVVVAPVGRRPESAVVGGRAPGAGHPVIAAITPRPVAGGPDVVGIGVGWLIVVGEGRWGLVGVLDGLFSGGFVGLVLVVVALDDGRGGLALVAFTLLLRGVGGAGAEDLGAAGGGGEVAVGWIGVGACRGGAVVDRGGVGCVIGTALAACEAGGEQGGCAKKPKGACK